MDMSYYCSLYSPNIRGGGRFFILTSKFRHPLLILGLSMA